MSEQVYGERRRRREAERAQQEAALRELQAAQGQPAVPETPPSRRDLRPAPPSTWDVPALEDDVEPRGSRRETASSVSHILLPVSPIQPVTRFTRSAAPGVTTTPAASATPRPAAARPAAPPQATWESSRSGVTPASRPQPPAVSRAPFHAPVQGPGEQGYPTAAIPTAPVPTAQAPARPPTIARPGSAPGVFGSNASAAPGAAPTVPGTRAHPAAKPHVGSWTPTVRPPVAASPAGRGPSADPVPGFGEYPADAPSPAAGSPVATPPDPRSTLVQAPSWGDMIQGSDSAPAAAAPTSPFGEPQAPPLSVFASPTSGSAHPGMPVSAGQVTPPPIPTSGIVIPTVHGQVPTPGSRGAVIAVPSWSAKADNGPPTGAPMLGGGAFASTAVKDRTVAAFEDDELPPHTYTWIQILVLFVVAFVLGMLIYLLINGGTSAVASGAVSAFCLPALSRIGGRRSHHHFTRPRPPYRGEL